MRYVLLEVCKFEDNEILAELVNGKDFNESLLLKIARKAPWGTWGNKEYWDIIRNVWELNKSHSENEEKMQVIGIDVNIDLPLDWMFKNRKIKNRHQIAEAKNQLPFIEKRDELMVAAIESYILNKGKKGYCTCWCSSCIYTLCSTDCK